MVVGVGLNKRVVARERPFRKWEMQPEADFVAATLARRRYDPGAHIVRLLVKADTNVLAKVRVGVVNTYTELIDQRT